MPESTKKGKIVRRRSKRRRSLEQEIERAKHFREKGEFLRSARLSLRLIRNINTPIDRMEEIADLFLLAHEACMNERGEMRCPECRAWAKITSGFTRCPVCEAEWPTKPASSDNIKS